MTDTNIIPSEYDVPERRSAEQFAADQALHLDAEAALLAAEHPGDCSNCRHHSDCALHNHPALPIAPCNCGRRRDELAIWLCKRDLRQQDRSFDEVVAPGVELWQRYLPEADELLGFFRGGARV